MKDYKQMADSVLGRVHEYEQQKQGSDSRVKIIGRTSAIVLPVLLIAAASVFAIKGGFGSSDISTADEKSSKENGIIAGGTDDHIGNSNTDNSSEPQVFAGDYWVVDSGENASSAAYATTQAQSSSSEPSSTDSTAENVPDGKSGNDQVMIAMIPSKNTKEYIGEKITREEAYEYFAKNAQSLASSLSASGVKLVERGEGIYCADESVLFINGTFLVRNGYCHVSYRGVKGEGLTIKQNFMDFPVFSGGKLVAIVTLVKENGLIYGTPAFGGPWFEGFQQIMDKYDKKKLLFLYAGAKEYIITPDNKVIDPQALAGNVPDSVKDSGLSNMKTDPYTWFYDESCAYTCYNERWPEDSVPKK